MGVNRERTKSISPSLLRNSLFPVPILSLAYSEVPKAASMDFSPLLPPAEPEVRYRVSPNSRSKLSQITRTSDRGILKCRT